MSDRPVASPIVESGHVAAPAAEVWAMVSDVTRMGEWSPETTSCRWVGGATGPEVGAAFVGANRNKLWRWSTRCRVTEAVPGESFAFEVSFAGLPISRWRYDFRNVGEGWEGCEVTESTTDARGRVMKTVGSVGTGVADRATHNRATMRATLAALATAAEGRARPTTAS